MGRHVYNIIEQSAQLTKTELYVLTKNAKSVQNVEGRTITVEKWVLYETPSANGGEVIEVVAFSGHDHESDREVIVSATGTTFINEFLDIMDLGLGTTIINIETGTSKNDRTFFIPRLDPTSE